jgi:uncharacterized repeat protein (TIGR01451 family)
VYWRILLTIAMALLSVAGPSSAFTQAEIDAAAQVARDIDIVETIADDVYEGREIGTSGSTAIQSVLIDELKLISNGLNTAGIGDDAYRQSFTVSCSKPGCGISCTAITPVTGTNLLGVIPGTDLANEYVIVSAHYDHVGMGASCSPGSEICNGATDNAAGVAVVLAIGAAIDSLPTAPRRSVILALWDGEEKGRLGSEAYAATPLVPLAATKAVVNFDIAGANLLPSLRDLSFAVGAESGGAALQTLVENAILAEDLGVRLFTRPGGQDRSDHARFIDTIPSVFFTDGTGSCYHVLEDEITAVDLEKLREQSQIGFRVALELAETSTPPTWQPTLVLPPLSFPGLPIYCWELPVYDDAVLILDMLLGAVADKHLLSTAQQTQLTTHHNAVSALVAGGPGSFTCGIFDGCLVTLASALQFSEQTLQSLRCEPFGPLELTKTSSPSPVVPLEQLTYSLTVENIGNRDEPSAVITDVFDQMNTTFVSASDGGSESAGVVTWPAVSVAAATSVVRSFSVEADASLNGLPAATRFSDDVESGGSQWTVSHGSGTDDWSIKNTDKARPDSGVSSWFGENVAVVSDQYLALASPYPVPLTGATLAFHHYYDLESSGGVHYDGGVVEISTDGAVWSDLGPAFENPYNGTSISSCCSNPLAGRPAFTGWSGGHIRSRFDLTPYAGSSVWIRFRLATDSVLAQSGWWIDDIEIGELIVNDALVDAGGAAHASVRNTTQVPEPILSTLLISGILGLIVLGRGRYRA